MERVIGFFSLPLSIFMVYVLAKDEASVGVYIIPLLLFFTGVSMLLGKKESSPKAIKTIKLFSDRIAITSVGIIAIFFFIGLLGGYNSCEEQYKKAWQACNEKYNGQCSYLGKDFKPSCDLIQ